MSIERMGRYFVAVEDPRCSGKVEHRLVEVLVPLHSGFDGLSVSGIERGQVGAVHLDGDAPSCAGVA